MDTKEIRKQLKEKLGYNSRQVSVKENSISLNWSFTFTIRDSSVDYQKVEEFAKSIRNIDWDEHHQEILSGANTFTDVCISDEVKDQWAAKYLPQLMEIKDDLSQLDDRKGISVAHYALFRQGGSGVKVADGLDDNMWFPMNYSIHGMRSVAIDMYLADLNRKVYRVIAENPATGQRLSWNFEMETFYCHDQFDKAHMLIGKTTYQIRSKIKEAMERLPGYTCETVEATDLFELFDEGVQRASEMEKSIAINSGSRC